MIVYTVNICWEVVGRRAWTGLIWFRMETGLAGCCERGNEPSGFIKCGRFIDYDDLVALQEGLSSMASC
jgi:hypothetical protein